MGYLVSHSVNDSKYADQPDWLLLDKWTMPIKSTWYSSFWEPSDHHPILVDFEMN